MADNITVKDSTGANKIFRTTEDGGLIHTPHHIPGTPLAYTLSSAATTNSTLVQAGASQLMTLVATNISAAVIWLKIFNKATAPTVGTDAPVLLIPIAVNAVVSLDLGTMGIAFPLGLGLCVTTGSANSNTGAVALGDLRLALSYL